MCRKDKKIPRRLRILARLFLSMAGENRFGKISGDAQDRSGKNILNGY